VPKNATYFENEDDEPRNAHHSPSPSDWLGSGRKKFSTKMPTFSSDSDQDLRPDGWRGFAHEWQPREPLWNPLLPAEKKEEALKFRDRDNDNRSMVFTLENAAEAFEAAGHMDLAAECERICEILCSEG
jgi:hypothetical protein